MRSKVEKTYFTDERLGSADNVVREDRPGCPVTGDARTLPAFANRAARSTSYPTRSKTCELRDFQNAGIVSGMFVAEQVMGVW